MYRYGSITHDELSGFMNVAASRQVHGGVSSPDCRPLQLLYLLHTRSIFAISIPHLCFLSNYRSCPLLLQQSMSANASYAGS